MKAMRGRIALKNTLCEMRQDACFCFAKLSECVRVLAPLWSFHMCVYALIQRR